MPVIRISLVAFVLLTGATNVFAAVSPVEKCTASKAKASGLAVYAFTQCRSKAVSSGSPVSPDCLAKAEAKLRSSWVKAAAKAACPGDVEVAVAAATACANGFGGAIVGESRCAAAKLKAVSQKARDQFGCLAKAASKGAAYAASCQTKVDLKLQLAIPRAEEKGACTDTVAALDALADTCVASLPPPPACAVSGWGTCGGSCPSGRTCQAYEVFDDGASVETGCACVDEVNGPECGGSVCGEDMHCPEPNHVCEQWTDSAGCDHSICQPAMVTPTTLPTRTEILCEEGDFPTCGGACPDGLRCQGFQASFAGAAAMSICMCVDPTAPRCEVTPDECPIDVIPFSHCADPSKTCLVDVVLEDDKIVDCTSAYCGTAVPTTTSTSVTTTSTSTTTSSSTSTSTSTSTTTSTLPCVSTPSVSGCFEDLGNCTVRDNCTGLQWEQKQNVPGPHHVNNRYVWGGCCSDGCATMCQPNAAASATCLAMAEVSTDGCGTTCPNGEECYVERGGLAITTIFDWVNQLNAEGFGGHSDWRVPTEAGLNASGTHELLSILEQPCTGFPCIDPIFGPTVPTNYWSRTSNEAREVEAWFVNFFDGGYGNLLKREAMYVRAVRGGS